MTSIVRQSCTDCGGSGERLHALASGASLKCPCDGCNGSGVRFVPAGYTQDEVEVVRNLVDALAVQRGVA